MRTLIFSRRNVKELLRDPLTLLFSFGFPVVLMLLFSILSSGIPEMPDQFRLENLAPGMVVFGMSFISLFLGMLISSDRDSSFLMRMFASPIRSAEYIAGYSLPLLPLAAAESILCFALAAVLGLPVTDCTFAAVAVSLPISLLFISFGVLFGSIFSSRQVGGISSILINIAAWLSGIWIPIDLIGGAFRTVCYILPFAHATDAMRAAASGSFAAMWFPLAVVLVYSAVLFAAASLLFRRKMKS